ncbi:uncharacterized protein SPPG_06812 [Spizellomyces punctatus DAOM BR117]|uniref:Cytochrome b5 heme-binding domain-containing protein n=1 Tax=Spizellomyces punctatus (strain DAOM BR117) TaxID=645134 RepID=A0A0L0H9F2_SPIPD|nr:uncharacterized protein SPPG_06812 [Spizellomyces punctatus DAOM BR117]KNC97817.1 hypothetical protein SPPG_06812 [Spizellomyces punctatus DAOM BR117]|eukprot:XP_016605857.1 hypothetical protein SPPG_06812 [Spizellomyces punctatus DAOM BR117]
MRFFSLTQCTCALLLAITLLPYLSCAQEFRSIDGTGNNADNKAFGSVNSTFARTLGGYNANALTSGLPDARAISNALAGVVAPIVSPRNITELFTYWGEFMATDLSHIIRSSKPTNATFTLPANGPLPPAPANESFTFGATDSTNSAPPDQINHATAFLDASNIYGTDPAVLASLRAPGGKLALRSDRLPLVVNGTNDIRTQTVRINGGLPLDVFGFGLVNGNTSPMLQCLYIIFMREHNRYVDELVRNGTKANDEQLFQLGRQHVIALIQHISYYEYIPVLFGANLLTNPAYNRALDPAMEALFSTVAFRYGHMEVTSTQIMLKDGKPTEFNLVDVFYNIQPVLQHGIFPFFAGMTKRSQLIPKLYVVPELRNVLFGNRPMDLFAIDIQRSREFGSPLYNDARRALGLAPAVDFTDVTKNQAIASTLRTLYAGDINKLDAIVGGLAEDHSPSNNIGDLFTKILIYQFTKTRDGDRFWFENDGVLTKEHLDEVRHTYFRDVIARNVPEIPQETAQKMLPRNLFQITNDASLDGGIPNGFAYSKSYLDNRYRLSWNINDRGGKSETIRGLLECASEGWCGLAFGEDMTVAEFMIVRPASNGSLILEERDSGGGFVRPVMTTRPPLVQVISSSFTGGIMTLEFQRAVRRGQASYSEGGALPILAAYSPQKAVATNNDEWFQFHQTNRQRIRLNFATGESTVSDNVTPRRSVHGIGMALIWGVVFPFGVFWSRYFRHLPGWMLVHILLQSIGCIAVIFLAAIPLIDPQNMGITTNAPHSYIGIILLVLVIIQLLLGGFNRQRLRWEKLRDASHYIRVAHHWVGRGMILLGLANIGFGLRRIYPNKDPSDGIWLVYYVVLVFWAALFAALEVFFRFKVRATRPDGPQMPVPIMQLDENGKDGTLTVIPTVTPVMAAMSAPVPMKRDPKDLEKQPLLRSFTWKDIDDAVIGGEHLVVGNGRWVYDIRPWLAHHPGGRLILDTVNGTDITIDFFNESDFDGNLGLQATSGRSNDQEKEFRVLPNALVRNGTPNGDHEAYDESDSVIKVNPLLHKPFTTSGPIVHHELSVETLRTNSEEKSEEESEHWIPPPDIKADEWKAVRRARWTHAHSKYAAEKLIGFIIGEISCPKVPSKFYDSADGSRSFDPYEYRRYAMVHKQLVTSKSAKRAVYRVKFALLYPFQGLRENEPTSFLPGQCVEIADRIQGQIVTRFYTPVSGSPSCFEVLIKVYPEGLMGQHIHKRKPGDRQLKVRGPFAEPLINPHPPLRGLHAGCWQTLVLVCGGAGISPGLQFVKEYLLPVGKTLVARERYVPCMEDEIALELGDRVRIMQYGVDGWATGLNLNTEEEGLLPLSLMTPPAGVSSRILLLNCASTLGDITSRETLQPAALAYPDILHIHNFVSDSSNLNVDAHAIVGNVHFGRLTEQSVRQLVGPVWAGADEQSRKVVICGPPSLEGMAYDALLEGLDIDRDDIVVLPPDSYHMGVQQ